MFPAKTQGRTWGKEGERERQNVSQSRPGSHSSPCPPSHPISRANKRTTRATGATRAPRMIMHPASSFSFALSLSFAFAFTIFTFSFAIGFALLCFSLAVLGRIKGQRGGARTEQRAGSTTWCWIWIPQTFKPANRCQMNSDPFTALASRLPCGPEAAPHLLPPVREDVNAQHSNNAPFHSTGSNYAYKSAIWYCCKHVLLAVSACLSSHLRLQCKQLQH